MNLKKKHKKLLKKHRRTAQKLLLIEFQNNIYQRDIETLIFGNSPDKDETACKYKLAKDQEKVLWYGSRHN